MEFKKYNDRFFRYLASAPFIYSMIIPLVLLDVWIEVYHRVTFYFYGIPYIIRKNYVRVDRHKLQYLSLFEKINCIYCGYANGLINYARVVAGETEKYWCGIKHKPGDGFVEPEHHADFIPYGDEEAYKKLSEKV